MLAAYDAPGSRPLAITMDRTNARRALTQCAHESEL
jgi:hypothetical protein